jgi:NADP oxidoreductase coenzyme F420-dependent
MMAQAILEPLIKRNVQPADQITVYDVNDQMMDNVASKFGVRTAQSLSELVHGADLVVCAVKPQNLTAGFFKEVRKGKPTDDAILLSIVAGKTMSEFERGGFSKIVRSMPNTPATIGQGMTVWSCSNNVSSVERRKVRDVLQTMGEQLYVDDESFIDMATSISGSGPAYIFMVRREYSRIWNVSLLVARFSLTESPEFAGLRERTARGGHDRLRRAHGLRPRQGDDARVPHHARVDAVRNGNQAAPCHLAQLGDIPVRNHRIGPVRARVGQVPDCDQGCHVGLLPAEPGDGQPRFERRARSDSSPPSPRFGIDGRGGRRRR